jgi:hypothetical protein
MSDVNPQGTPAPTPEPTTAPAPVAATPEPDAKWLNERLQRAQESARKAVLTELGIDDPTAAKAALDAAKAAAEANKSAEQRAAELSAKLTSTQSEAQRLTAIAQEHAARMMAVLTTEQQAAVKAVAGDDPSLQLKAIGALGPTWAAQQPVQPANTAPPADAPPATATTSPPDHRTIYTTTRATNPFAAAAYGLSNPGVYETK